MNYRMKWATRVGIHIDRAACACLIRRSLARTRQTTCPKPVSVRQASHNQVSAGHGFWTRSRMRPMRRSKWIESGLRIDLVGS